MRKLLPYILSFLCGAMLIPALLFLNYEIKKEGDLIVLAPQPIYQSGSQEVIPELSGSSSVEWEKEESSTVCARNRWILKSALMKSRERGKQGSVSLNIFSLISQGLLKEVPNCPRGGTYSLKGKDSDTVLCTVHGETKTSS